MLIVTDLYGNSEPLTDFKLSRKRRVNGEKTIDLVVNPSIANEHSYKLVQEESTISFDGDDYIIKKYNERSRGNKIIKTVVGIHKFYVDLSNKQTYTEYDGSLTFHAALTRVFEGTGYTFAIVGSFTAKEFEGFGNESRLSMFQKVLVRYQAENEVNGTHVIFKERIGNDTDFQFRYAFNVRALEQSFDTSNLATYIEGTGAEGVTATYTSPNASIFGILDAPKFENEWYTSEPTLREAMKSVLQDTPEFSISLDYEDLRSAGYPYVVPNEGDRIFVIYEPMENLEIETRILEIEEEFDVNLKPIKSSVVLANHKKTFAGTMLGVIKKALKPIVDDGGKIRNTVIDDAIIRATKAIQNAQTELVFPEIGGIHAIDKTDPNKMVVYNSAGLGITSDGGQSFRNAITGGGIVAEAIYGEFIYGVNIVSDNVDGIFSVHGANAEFREVASGRYVQITPNGIFGYNANNSLRFQANSTLVTSAALGTTQTNTYLASRSGEARVVEFDDIPGDGLIGSYRYLPIRASGFYGNFWNINTGSGASAVNLYARPLTAGELRITLNGTTDQYRDLRARELFTNMITYNSMYGESQHLYARMPGEFRVVTPGGLDSYRPVRASGFLGTYLDLDAIGNPQATHIYVRPSGSPGELRVTVRGTTDVYRPVRASNYLLPSGADAFAETFSLMSLPPQAHEANELIKEIEVMRYTDNGLPAYRIVSEESPAVAVADGEATDVQKALNLLVKSNQELVSRIETLEGVS